MLNALDLFSGAGGFSLGLHMAGINTVGAVEVDKYASATYRQNFTDVEVLEADIRQISDTKIKNHFGGVDLIVAGPPCQGFSVAGPAQYGKIDTHRNSLILEVSRVVKALKPTMVVMENVKGILSGKLTENKKAVDEYVSVLSKLNYEVKIFLLQSADFGVPQWRERVFIFGVRNSGHMPVKINGDFGTSKKPWRTVDDALSDLPIINSGESVIDGYGYPSPPKTAYQQWLRKGSKGVFNHEAMLHTARLIERFKHIPHGGSIVNAPKELGQRRRNGTELDFRPRFKMNNQRLDPDHVSAAITASFQSSFVHPHLNRNITAREGARLQSFPDRFIFQGPRTLMSKLLLKREGREDEIGLSQYNQIGNSVAPLVAEAIGKEIIKCLKR